jgi:hypothetical protein
MKWNVIWQVNPDDYTSCIERDWFNELTSLAPINSVIVDYQTKPLLQHIVSGSIICVSCPNQTSPQDLVEYLRRIPKPRVVFLMSDEFMEVGHDVHEQCELTIRNGSADFNLRDDPTHVQIPLGYVSGLRNGSQSFPKSSCRKCSFAFLGTIKHDRETEMLSALRAIPGSSFIRKTPSFEAATRHFNLSTIAVYKNAVFVPNPKGNWNPECNRLYDALEWGCIPLVKRYADSEYHMHYHDRLLGSHPIPTFDDWRQSAEFASSMLSDHAALDALQTEISDWWANYKSVLRAKISNKLADLSEQY